MHSANICKARTMPSQDVCPSVCPTHAGILCKRLSVSHTIWVFLYQTSWRYSDKDPLTGASNAGGVGKNRDSRRIAGYRSMTAGVRTTTATVYRALYHTDGDTSVNLCMDDEDEENRTEQNLFVRSGKSEAEVTNKWLRSTYCTTKANYWQTRSIARPLCDSRATCTVYSRKWYTNI